MRPARDNDCGRTGGTREVLRRWLPGYQARMRAFGALPMDARKPLDQVTDAILAQAHQARAPASRG